MKSENLQKLKNLAMSLEGKWFTFTFDALKEAKKDGERFWSLLNDTFNKPSK